jgi:predicted phosphate transport protein (TIGR00153 family)
MARKQSYDYFDVFVKQAQYSCDAAYIVNETLHNFNYRELPEKLEKIHAIEHAADKQKHKLIKALAREFLPPIEIEDITEMTQLLDDVTDSIEDILIKLYSYNIKSIRPEAVGFSDIISTCCETLKKMMGKFSHFKKTGSLITSIVEINKLESDGDDLYTKTMHDLHVSSDDPIEILTWSRLLDCLEKCCDAMEDVADAVENIVMKNT